MISFLLVLGEGQECSLVDDNGDGEMYGAYVEEEENKHDGWIACKQKASFMHIFCSLNVFHQLEKRLNVIEVSFIFLEEARQRTIDA